MEHNVGSKEGILRFSIGFILLVTSVDFFAVYGNTTLWWVSLIPAGLAVILGCSGVAHFCPIYKALGRSTC